jgi:hypothetical protein
MLTQKDAKAFVTHAPLKLRLQCMQLTTLERIAHHKRRGVLRSELSKQLNTDAKNFHYVVMVQHLPTNAI